MSIPLQDVGNLKLPQHIHSFQAAKGEITGKTMKDLIRDYVEKVVTLEIHIFSLANDKHKSRGFGEILGDVERRRETTGVEVA